ncbi:TPA: transcriptional regulator [Escherichia coli]|nr:transcriptional regulator [Escherichia coli]HBE6120757.1 transcriptional regulator [Escherichia coli]HBE6157068.1 transcriptional regulator [Escherichia coli]HBE6179467.1 transcriptional regulator [Escherichia coli]HBE6184076.1 transcriptional regulator [Escherichia coli]
MRYSILNPDTIHSVKYLSPGNVSPEHFQYLMALSKTRGRKIDMALEDYLVKGKSRKEIFETYNISPGYFSLKLNQLRQCSRIVMDMMRFYR